MQSQSVALAHRSRKLGWCVAVVKFALLAALPFGEGSKQASAQGLNSTFSGGSAPSVGSSGGTRAPAILNGTQNVAAKRHVGPTGKPCLTVQGERTVTTYQSGYF